MKQRRILAASFFATGVALAAPPQSGPGPAPAQPPATTSPARIVSMKPVGLNRGGVYTSGPIIYDIEVAASASSPLDTNVTIKQGASGPETKLPITAKAGTRATVRFTESEGLGMCGGFYLLGLESVPTAQRSAKVKSSCKITLKPDADPVKPPFPTSKLYFTEPVATLACSENGLEGKVTAKVTNGTQFYSQLKLKLDGPKNNTLSQIEMGKGVSKNMEVRWNKATPGEYAVSVAGIVSTGVSLPAADPWKVRVSLTCEPDVDLN